MHEEVTHQAGKAGTTEAALCTKNEDKQVRHSAELCVPLNDGTAQAAALTLEQQSMENSKAYWPISAILVQEPGTRTVFL